MKSQLLNINLKEIPQEKRYELFKLAVEKYGLKPKDLGIDRTTKYKILRKQRKISDKLLETLIQLLPEQTIMELCGPAGTAPLRGLSDLTGVAAEAA